MAYSLDDEDKMLSLFESIANQPIEQQRPYNETSNPRPIVESTAMFEGKMVDLSTWTADSKKVGKAKTAVNPDLSKGAKAAKGAVVETKASKEQVTENDVVTEKKEDKKVTKLVTEDTTHEAKGEPKAKTGSFDSKAKSTASAQRSKADSNKKFSEESKRQRKIDMFRDFVKSLGIDEKSKADAEKVLKKFDQISKHIGEPGDGKVKPKLESMFNASNNSGKLTAVIERIIDEADSGHELSDAEYAAVGLLDTRSPSFAKWMSDGLGEKYDELGLSFDEMYGDILSITKSHPEAVSAGKEVIARALEQFSAK